MDRSTPTQSAPANGPVRPASIEESGRRVELAKDGPIVFFDGVCGFCNRFVDFVIRRDRAGLFRFAPLQGETARKRLPGADVRDLNTVVLWEEPGVYRKSTAAARILMRLGGAWRFAGAVIRVIPRPLRDMGYTLVARYRYALFGKKETCRVPTPAERSRFLP